MGHLLYFLSAGLLIFLEAKRHFIIMETRNPSPPPDADPNNEQNDQIGDTVYSKRWFHSLVLQVLTEINKTDEQSNDLDELSSSLEEKLCCLWDITSDQTLLVHLRQFQLVSAFTECVRKSKCPRLIVNAIHFLKKIVQYLIRNKVIMYMQICLKYLIFVGN